MPLPVLSGMPVTMSTRADIAVKAALTVQRTTRLSGTGPAFELWHV